MLYNLQKKKKNIAWLYFTEMQLNEVNRRFCLLFNHSYKTNKESNVLKIKNN